MTNTPAPFRRPRRASAAAFALAAAAPCALAQPAGYPARPVRIIVPQAAGGSTDLCARLVGQYLAERLGQPFVVDNRPGAGSIIGTDLVAKAAPDGYTLLVVAASITINPVLQKNLPFQPLRDFAPVTVVASYPMLLAVHPGVPVRSVPDLVRHARERPGRVTVGNSGIGTATHLAAGLFRSMAGLDWLNVPFKGGSPAVTALLGGEVQAMFATLPSVLPHVRSSRLRALAVTGARRSPFAPEVPTVAESGLPGYEASFWNSMFAPAATPPAIVALLNRTAVAALRSEDARAKLAGEGAEPVGSTSAELAAVLRSDTDKWARVIRDAGIRPE